VENICRLRSCPSRRGEEAPGYLSRGPLSLRWSALWTRFSLWQVVSKMAERLLTDLFGDGRAQSVTVTGVPIWVLEKTTETAEEWVRIQPCEA